MRIWQAAQTCSAILALSLLLASVAGSGSSTSSASSQPATNATPTPTRGTGPSPSPTPTRTGSATVINRVEESPWLTCGACGNNGGVGPTATYFDTLGIATPR